MVVVFSLVLASRTHAEIAAAQDESRRFAGILFFGGILAIMLKLIAIPIGLVTSCVGLFTRRPVPIWALPMLAVSALFAIGFLSAGRPALVVCEQLSWLGGLAGLAVWHGFAGWSGQPGLSPAFFRGLRPVARAGVVSGIALLALLSFLGLRNAVPVIGVLVAPPGLGTPPYRTEFPRDMTLPVTLALARFPDVASCLPADAGGDLTRMDWDKIETKAEAEVCLFRLLVGNGDMARAPALLQKQGFKVSTAPIDLEDRLYLQASWSISVLGPRFPTHGWSRYRAAIPYAMGVNTVWDPTGQNLLGVGLDFAVE